MILTPSSGVFLISYANIACLPYRTWLGSRDEGAFLLFLGMLGQEEHLERGESVHHANSKRLLEYRVGHEMPRTEQGGSWQNRVEPLTGAGDFPEADSKFTSFEDDILGHQEALSVVI